MKTFILATLLALSFVGRVEAGEVSTVLMLKPMSGPAVAHGGERFLLNVKIGTKQAVTYYLNESGKCHLTVMIADAAVGDNVPNMTTVRFAAAIAPGSTAHFDTAEGKALEFACNTAATAMSVKAKDRISPPGT